MNFVPNNGFLPNNDQFLANTNPLYPMQQIPTNNLTQQQQLLSQLLPQQQIPGNHSPQQQQLSMEMQHLNIGPQMENASFHGNQAANHGVNFWKTFPRPHRARLLPPPKFDDVMFRYVTAANRIATQRAKTSAC